MEKKKKNLVLDTNFLLLPYQFKIDIFRELEDIVGEYSIVISTTIFNELKNLSTNKGKKGMAAKFGIKIVNANKAKVIETTVTADDWIVDYSFKKGAIVCTNEKELKKRLKSKKIKVIGMKSKSKLGFL